MAESRTFVIVGASQAGGWIAKTLRAEGFEGRIVLIGEEHYLPYERPPLSKAALLGEVGVDSTYFWPPETYEDLDIEVRLNTRVTSIDRGAKQVVLADGETIGYDRLALTTGTRPRRLALDGSDLDGIHYLRTMDDTLAIREDLQPGTNVVIVGGGWIGLECAGTLTKLGCKAIVVEFAERLCSRAVAPDISDWLLDFHCKRGVDVRLETSVSRFEGNGKITRAVLSDGATIDCSLAIIGIGVLPNSELAAQAGLKVENGIEVDDHCRTSDPDIFAAGDVTFHPNAILGHRLRLESWENAQNQGIAAARSMLDKGEAYGDIPWFWSDQFDANIQMIGLPENWDHAATRGSREEGEFVTFYLRAGLVVGAISINNPRDLRFAKRLMQMKKQVSVADLENPDVKLQALVKG